MGKIILLVFAATLLFLGTIGLLLILRFVIFKLILDSFFKASNSIFDLSSEIARKAIFIFGPASTGAFIVGFGLKILQANNAKGGALNSNPANPILFGFLAFFSIIALRTFQLGKIKTQKLKLLDDHPNPTYLDRTQESYTSLQDYILKDAWDRAIKMTPKSKDVILNAQSICNELLRASEGDFINRNQSIAYTATLIRNHLVSLVDSTERRLATTPPSKHKEITDEMVKFLIGFSQKAQQSLQLDEPSMEDKDTALRAHLAAQPFSDSISDAQSAPLQVRKRWFNRLRR